MTTSINEKSKRIKRTSPKKLSGKDTLTNILRYCSIYSNQNLAPHEKEDTIQDILLAFGSVDYFNTSYWSSWSIQALPDSYAFLRYGIRLLYCAILESQQIHWAE